MEINKKLHSVALASAVLILFLILVSSIASAATEQSVSQVGPYAYITNGCSDTVSVIDTATNTVTATVDVGSEPYGIAVNPAGTKVYVTNGYGDSVSVIDTATNTVTARVLVGSSPRGVAVNPEGTKVYVANEASDGTVSVIDTATNKVTATVNVEEDPCGVAVNPVGTKVYVTNFGNDSVSVIDIATDTVTARIDVGYNPLGVAVSPEGTKVYVANFGSDDGTVSVIDTATNTVTAGVPVGDDPLGVAVNPEGTKVYVVNHESNTVSVIDTATNNIAATVSVGDWPNGVAVTPDGKYVYVANGYSNNVSVIDAATNTVTASVPVGDCPVAFGQFIGTPSVQPVLPIAAFSASPTSGKVPLTVAFTDKSTDSPTSWSWTFGDGSTSTSKSPAHTYSKAGKYTVKLTVKNAAGSSTKTITNYITVKTAPVKPVSAFSATPTSGNAPLKVTFTDKSTNNPTSWKWSFGDGSTSTSKNPAHTYTKAGKYTVKLTVKNAAGSSTKTITNYITVKTAPVKPVSAFSATPISGKVPLKVQFTDKSSNVPTSWKWSFGDGSTSTLKNPAHTYNKAGKYTVKLTVKNTKGSSTKTMSGYITVSKK
jgi:YVTN family beta-propeller protein